MATTIITESARGERKGKVLLTSRHNDNDNQDDDNDDQANTHLHILPPHLFPHSVGSTAETLGGYSQIVRLILKRVEALTTLGDLVNVLTHHANGVVDLLSRID